MRSITRRLRNRRWTDNYDHRTGRGTTPGYQRDLTASATRIQIR